MANFENVFGHYRELNQQLKERSETFNILNQGKQIDIGQIIYTENRKHNTIRGTRKKFQNIYNITRASVHVFWTLMALYMLNAISWEDACLVHMGYPKPYMVFKPGSQDYVDQLNYYGGEEVQDLVLQSLGSLYQDYDFDHYFHFIFRFGPEWEEDKFKWINFQIYLQMLCMGTIFFEFLQVLRYFLMLKGYKMNKGIGLAMKSGLALLPLFGMITFFFETKYVLGFMGDTCFCKFQEYWERVDPNGGYYCMDEIGGLYQKLIYIKLVYVSITLFVTFYQFQQYSIKNSDNGF